jgi:glucose/mannose transport system substrate-binding protein
MNAFTKRWRLAIIPLLGAALVVLAVACGGGEEASPTPTVSGSPTASATAAPLTGELEIFSWWTTGGEAAGLQALYDLYPQQCPGDVQIVNSTIAGGGGDAARQVLSSRMQGGDPPGTFQIHMGHELLDSYVASGDMEPLTDLYASQGWNDIFPQGVIDIVSKDGVPYSVPVNIHRANVLWYNKATFAAHNLTAPTTFDQFFQVADTLQAAGITPLALGDKEAFASVQLLETTLLGSLGPDKYKGLWTGDTDWSGADVTTALETFKRMLSYTNSDHASLTWDQANQLVIDGTAGMTIMGDWLDGDNTAKGFTDSGWVPAPGTSGSYDALSDTFGLPKGAPNPDAVNCWLKLVGSKAGQEAFNPKKGSICARTDCDPSLFDTYLKSAIDDWKTDTIVPSLAHGAAASPSFASDISDAVTAFVADRDVATLQGRLATACQDAGVCS